MHIEGSTLISIKSAKFIETLSSLFGSGLIVTFLLFLKLYCDYFNGEESTSSLKLISVIGDVVEPS